MDKRYKRILIINTFGIGDVLLSTPLVRALKQAMPDSTIDFMCNRRAQYILHGNRNINDIIIFEKDEFRASLKDSKKDFAKKIYNFSRDIKSRRYDLVIDLSLGYQLALFLALVGIKKRIGFNFRNRGRFLTDKVDIKGFNDRHVVDYYLDVLRLIGIKDIDDKHLELEPIPEFEEWAWGFIKRSGLEGKLLVGLGPGGGKSWGENALYRRWSPENFGYVASRLAERMDSISFVIFGSDEEVHLCDTIMEALGDRIVNLCGKLSLPQSIALIKRCELILCNDGGILHIATAQGIKTVSIFGPVDDKVYGPYPPGARNKVVVAQGVECRPCYQNFKQKKCEHHECLRKIDSSVVLSAAEEMLGIRKMISSGTG